MSVASKVETDDELDPDIKRDNPGLVLLSREDPTRGSLSVLLLIAPVTLIHPNEGANQGSRTSSSGRFQYGNVGTVVQVLTLAFMVGHA